MNLLYALQRKDVQLFMALYRHGERGRLRPLARVLSRTADGHLFIFIPLLFLICGVTDVANLVALLLFALSLELPLYGLLKSGFKRRRPEDYIPDFSGLIVAADRFSFPSGHTAAAFLLATSLYLVYGPVALGMYLWASAVAASRVLLGVHYPGDTVAGAAMGGVIAFMSHQYLLGGLL